MRAGMLALDGRCKTLDAAADGYVRAENCVAFLLSAQGAAGCALAPAGAAVVVRGSAVNQDGRSSGLTAPNGPAQQAVMRDALASGSVASAMVAALEMHGTGTALGDPIEVGAAVAVLQEQRRLRALGFSAAKSRLGHAETGAGVLGMLHAWHQLCQASPLSLTHLRAVNPYVASSLDGARQPVQLPRQAAPLALPTAEADTYCVGISAFAFHVSHLVAE